MTTVLVTAVGGIAGYGVVRALRRDLPGARIIGVDTEPHAVGLRWCDVTEPAVAAAAPGFIDWLRGVSRSHGVDVIVPTHPAELLPLATWQQLDVPIVIERPELIRRTTDKWLSFELLRQHDDPAAIPTVRVEPPESGNWQECFESLSESLSLPFLLKPRLGSGSRGIRVVECTSDLVAERRPEEFIAQRIVGSDDEEYTVAVFGDGDGGVCARIALRRELDAGGWTRRATLANPPGLDHAVDRIVRFLRPRGPINLQFRRDGEHWWLLEVNPRISSSTHIRSLLGYPEAAMAVQHALTGQLPSQPELRAGTVQRYVEEQLI